jgi:hypothetical protein
MQTTPRIRTCAGHCTKNPAAMVVMDDSISQFSAF